METSPDTLRQVTAPVLLIIGDRDAGSIVSEEIAADAAASMPNLQVIHLAGANHDIRRARFDGYMEALRGFLERPPADPARSSRAGQNLAVVGGRPTRHPHERRSPG